jgi:universal protein Kae1
MRCLGIESTAHTFGVGIATDDGEILANEKNMYEPDEGGIHPRKAAEHHYREALNVYQSGLATADLSIADIDCIAFSQGPGMPPILDVGAVFARSLAVTHDLPLYGVNHVHGHIEVGRLTTDADDPVVLFVSGGNSQVIAYAGGRYRVFGETQDIAIGNALDKLARRFDIPHPGGPRIEELAEQGDDLLEMSYVVKGMDFSFSGLVTEARRLYEQDGHSKEDVCFSFQEHTFAMLVEATERAMAHLDKDDVLLTGGVAANARLRDMVDTMCEARGATAYSVPLAYAMDNGAMIAWQGIQEAGVREPDNVRKSGIRQNWRVDEIDATWR